MLTHQHPQSEVYHVLEGQGVVTIEDEDYVLGKGSTLFISGGCEHGTRSTADCSLKIFYMFAVNSFQEVEYIFSTDDTWKGETVLKGDAGNR
ncbi:MAG TPA: cupin domain-containing protein [Desulfopila sp.]|nr:cupin domain-containing protein [Desulfopila sp.]